MLNRITTMIEAGQYRDEILGFPGVALEGRGNFYGDRRIYRRGSPELAEASAQGLVDRLPPLEGADPEAIAEAEAVAGAALPPLLGSLYARANGGFGPSYGILGLRGGFTDDQGHTAVDILRAAAEGRWPTIPSGLVPLCHWGCGVYSFVHVPTGRIHGWDPNPVDLDLEVPFFEQEYVLQTWLEAWLDGTLHQPWLLYEPDEGICRGATIAESREAFA